MITKKNIFIIGFIMFFALLAHTGYAANLGEPFGSSEDNGQYIKVLGITVVEEINGEVIILKIGRYGPFRRYSWFRVGDVIEAVDGMKMRVFELQAILPKENPKIRFRRGERVAERQISLERNVYGVPSYVKLQ